MKAANILKKDDQRATVYLIGQIFVQLLSTISVFVFARLLSAEEYGVVAVYTTWSVFLSYFMGLQSHGTLGIAKVHKNEDYEQYCIIPYILTLITSVAALLLALGCLKTVNRLSGVSGPIIIFMIFHTAGTTFFNIQNSIYRMDMKAVSYVVNNVLVNCAAILLSIVLILGFSQDRETGRILGMGIPYILFGTFFCFKAVVKRKVYFDKDLYSFCIKLSIPLVFHSISAQILSHSDTLMLAHMRNDAETGIYSFCYSVATPLTGIWSAFDAAWQPDYLEKMKKGDKEWLKKHSNNYLFNFTVLMCGYLLVCQEILKIMGSEEYWAGSSIVPLIVIVPYLQFLYAFPSSYEFYIGKTKMVAIGTGIAAIINIFINWLFIPQFGMYATTVSTVIAYLVLFLLHDVFARKIGAYCYNWSFYFKGIIPVAICIAATYVFSDYVLVRWGIGSIAAIILGVHVLKTKTLL